MRMLGLLKSIRDWPPSPPTASNQLTGLAVNAHVPLSCEPPITSVFGCNGLTARLWNWIVARPEFRLKICVGIAFNQPWQSVRSAPVRPRLAQVLEASTKSPLVRTRPPSEPMKAIPGLLGAKAITCWSGCMPCGGDCASSVMSVKLTPASVERWMARPFDGGLAVKISEYCIAPPIQTVSGWPGGDAIGISYEHWGLQKLNDAKPGVPLVELESFNQPGFLVPSVNPDAGTLASSTR